MPICQDTVISQNFVKENSATLSDTLTVIYSSSNSELWKSILYVGITFFWVFSILLFMYKSKHISH